MAGEPTRQLGQLLYNCGPNWNGEVLKKSNLEEYYTASRYSQVKCLFTSKWRAFVSLSVSDRHSKWAKPLNSLKQQETTVLSRPRFITSFIKARLTMTVNGASPTNKLAPCSPFNTRQAFHHPICFTSYIYRSTERRELPTAIEIFFSKKSGVIYTIRVANGKADAKENIRPVHRQIYVTHSIACITILYQGFTKLQS